MSINTITTEDLRRMEGKDGLILQGCGGDAQEMKDRVFASGSYSEALCIIGEYVNITDSEAEPERKLSLRQQLKETKPAEPARSQKQPKQPER